MPLSFSTCWNSNRHTRGDEMLNEICALGFDHVELGHGIRQSLWEGIEQFLADHPMKVTSLHNFCPLPVEIQGSAPDCYQCTSTRAAERDRARHYTLQTIDYAHRLGAKRVVVHLGSVLAPDFTERLIRSIYAGQYLDRRYIRSKLDAIRKREAVAAYDGVIEWLQPVRAHAKAAGVTLGIENRIGIETFPSEREFRRLFKEIADDTIGYWHDFGHAQVRHNLTLIDHAEWLAEMSPRLIGCHIHDVRFPARDHRVPFSGMIDFESLLSSLTSEQPMVWELSSSASKDDIVAALTHWKERFPEIPRQNNDAPAGQAGSAG
jgi:sugar phosphate isomerase/epimerase